nr:protein SPIRAL1-like 1 [Tanacetum cinerariifolium]
MNRGVSSGGGQSSLNYLFRRGEAPKPALKATQAALAANNMSAAKPDPVSPFIDVTKQIPACQSDRTIFKNLSLRHISYSERIESLERSKEKASGQRDSGLRKEGLRRTIESYSDLRAGVYLKKKVSKVMQSLECYLGYCKCKYNTKFKGVALRCTAL